MIKEHPANCPYYGEPTLLLIDYSSGEQNYFEDYQVCCRPVLVKLSTDTATDDYILKLYREEK